MDAVSLVVSILLGTYGEEQVKSTAYKVLNASRQHHIVLTIALRLYATTILTSALQNQPSSTCIGLFRSILTWFVYQHVALLQFCAKRADPRKNATSTGIDDNVFDKYTTRLAPVPVFFPEQAQAVTYCVGETIEQSWDPVEHILGVVDDAGVAAVLCALGAQTFSDPKNAIGHGWQLLIQPTDWARTIDLARRLVQTLPLSCWMGDFLDTIAAVEHSSAIMKTCRTVVNNPLVWTVLALQRPSEFAFATCMYFGIAVLRAFVALVLIPAYPSCEYELHIFHLSHLKLLMSDVITDRDLSRPTPISLLAYAYPHTSQVIVEGNSPNLGYVASSKAHYETTSSERRTWEHMRAKISPRVCASRNFDKINADTCRENPEYRQWLILCFRLMLTGVYRHRQQYRPPLGRCIEIVRTLGTTPQQQMDFVLAHHNLSILAMSEQNQYLLEQTPAQLEAIKKKLPFVLTFDRYMVVVANTIRCEWVSTGILPSYERVAFLLNYIRTIDTDFRSFRANKYTFFETIRQIFVILFQQAIVDGIIIPRELDMTIQEGADFENAIITAQAYDIEHRTSVATSASFLTNVLGLSEITSDVVRTLRSLYDQQSVRKHYLMCIKTIPTTEFMAAWRYVDTMSTLSTIRLYPYVQSFVWQTPCADNNANFLANDTVHLALCCQMVKANFGTAVRWAGAGVLSNDTTRRRKRWKSPTVNLSTRKLFCGSKRQMTTLKTIYWRKRDKKFGRLMNTTMRKKQPSNADILALAKMAHEEALRHSVRKFLSKQIGRGCGEQPIISLNLRNHILDVPRGIFAAGIQAPKNERSQYTLCGSCQRPVWIIPENMTVNGYFCLSCIRANCIAWISYRLCQPYCQLCNTVLDDRGASTIQNIPVFDDVLTFAMTHVSFCAHCVSVIVGYYRELVSTDPLQEKIPTLLMSDVMAFVNYVIRARCRTGCGMINHGDQWFPCSTSKDTWRY